MAIGQFPWPRLLSGYGYLGDGFRKTHSLAPPPAACRGWALWRLVEWGSTAMMSVGWLVDALEARPKSKDSSDGPGLGLSNATDD